MNSKDGESSDEKKAKVDKKKKEEKQYLYNVPYIFSRVEKPKMHKLVISRVTNFLEQALRFRPLNYKDDEEEMTFDNYEIMLKKVNNLHELVEKTREQAEARKRKTTSYPSSRMVSIEAKG